jgi:hypothetical protein
MMKPLTVCALVGLVLACVGCDASALRSWQSAPLPTHDAQLAFDSARDVLAKHFEVATLNWAQGAIETKPQPIEQPRNATMADYRGAKSRWRRTVYFETTRDGLSITGNVAVRLERESTAEATAMTGSMDTGSSTSELPRTGAEYSRAPSKPPREVWTEVGYDASLAREILAEISTAVSKIEGAEPTLQAPTSQDIGNEMKNLPRMDRP